MQLRVAQRGPCNAIPFPLDMRGDFAGGVDAGPADDRGISGEVGAGMIVTILGKRWKFRWVTRSEMPKAWGTCDAPDQPGKEIRIRKGQSEIDELDTVIHEVLHASDWHKSEEWVAEVAEDLARILIKLGWRRHG